MLSINESYSIMFYSNEYKNVLFDISHRSIQKDLYILDCLEEQYKCFLCLLVYFGIYISDTIFPILHKYNTRTDFVFVSIFALHKRKIKCIDNTSKIVNILILQKLIDKQDYITPVAKVFRKNVCSVFQSPRSNLRK